MFGHSRCVGPSFSCRIFDPMCVKTHPTVVLTSISHLQPSRTGLSNYRRSYTGRTYFFTAVTQNRRRWLTSDLARSTLRHSIAEVRQKRPFEIVAIVLLPDHLHTVWELPREDVDFSTRWRHLKSSFTRRWHELGGMTFSTRESQNRRGERGLWQRRFFEHQCRDEEDLKRCVDYIHVNPLKHGYVTRVLDWPWSSFHRYLAQGEYSPEWGSSENWYGDEFLHFE